jgi:hypothetical protein
LEELKAEDENKDFVARPLNRKSTIIENNIKHVA